jgi:hypothetical protein
MRSGFTSRLLPQIAPAGEVIEAAFAELDLAAALVHDRHAVAADDLADPPAASNGK